jgi:short-subunit dehydrogenase involved in D-alanine esterification of teichoic acids
MAKIWLMTCGSSGLGHRLAERLISGRTFGSVGH